MSVFWRHLDHLAREGNFLFLRGLKEFFLRIMGQSVISPKYGGQIRILKILQNEMKFSEL